MFRGTVAWRTFELIKRNIARLHVFPRESNDKEAMLEV